MSDLLPKEEQMRDANNIICVCPTPATAEDALGRDTPSAELLEHEHAAQAMIRDIFQRFPPAEIGISFNGGKDSVVMFELIRRTMPMEVIKQCCTFVIDLRDEFDEVLDFRAQYMRRFAAEVTLTHQEVTVDMRESLWRLMEKQPLKAVFMGTRKTDPHGKYQQSAVEKTTPGWPDFLRVCPLFSWSVNSVWEYTRLHGIPQCCLYEDGYTSLGNTSNTSRNPKLKREDGTYRPAWELAPNCGEREGRHHV